MTAFPIGTKFVVDQLCQHTTTNDGKPGTIMVLRLYQNWLVKFFRVFLELQHYDALFQADSKTIFYCDYVGPVEVVELNNEQVLQGENGNYYKPTPGVVLTTVRQTATLTLLLSSR